MISPRRSKAAAARSRGRLDHDSGVAVVEAELVVVLGHEERAADVPGVVGREAVDGGREPAFDPRRPGCDALRASTVGAEHAECAERLERFARGAGLGRPRRPRGLLRSAPSRTAVSASEDAGSAVSTGIQVTPSGASSRTSITSSALPRRIASASWAMPAPKRWTRSRTTMPLPIVRSGWGIFGGDRVAGGLGRGGLARPRRCAGSRMRARRCRRGRLLPRSRRAGRGRRRGSGGRPGGSPRRVGP